jgi:hypothetical protein
LTFGWSFINFLSCLENLVSFCHISEFHSLLRKSSTHTHCMSWVIYLKFLSAGKFVLIEYLTLIYILAYFCNAIWLFYQLIIHACFEANFWEKYFFCKFFSSFIFSVWSVRTDLFLCSDEHSLAVRCPSCSRLDG